MKLFRSIFAATLLASAAPTALLAALVWWRAGAEGTTLALVAGSFGLALATSASFAWWLARRISLPLRACVRGALEIARGRFGHQVALGLRGEINDLAYAFNHMSRELARQNAENQGLIAQLEAGWLATIRSLASAIDAKDPYTRGHSQRVSELSVEIGRELGLTEPELKALAWGGLLHDVGKIGVPEAVLRKAGRLSPEESALMRAHPDIGAAIVGGAEFLRDALPCVRSHHERWDGGGYPDGLGGEDIPRLARIVNAADTFDACTSERPYQEAMTADAALEILARLRGAQIDPRVHDAILRVVKRRAGGAGVARSAATA
ncbi:MAG TPA: HD domain-containing phosphohydrolase [Anaeromyxobacteraceae bacterium]|nr:HD domain-containing phosphohydrolase [Anaeromyxobacteraceae bacterium]